MNILTNKTKLSEEIKRQENTIKQLNEEKSNHLKEISALNEKINRLSAQIDDYEEQYVHMSLECEFCYTGLKKEFLFCPKCGKKIPKRHKEICPQVHDELFETESDIGGVLIVQYNGFNEKVIRIPGYIDGKRVVGIWNGVFEKCIELEEVYIEEGCRYICKNVFAGCTNLKHIHLPKSLAEIGDNAFSNCAIEELAVPPNVKAIGSYAFASKSLRKIVLPEGLARISSGMLARTSIAEIEIPQSVIHIESYAFGGSMLKEIELPRNLYSIGSYAFEIANLKKIIIHSNVEIMEENVFGKNFKPTICCAAGSKAQLYARKYGLECHEISKQPVTDIRSCARAIEIQLGSVQKGVRLEELYRHFGFCKAETWSWKYTNQFTIHILKTMEMEEAQYIKTKIKSYIDNHSDWSKPGIHCTVRTVDIW